MCPRIQPRFNPTLVRLRPALFVPDLTGRKQFQSHAGSIEATGDAGAIEDAYSDFNPTLVRLRLRMLSATLLIAVSISIPRWFD